MLISVCRQDSMHELKAQCNLPADKGSIRRFRCCVEQAVSLKDRVERGLVFQYFPGYLRKQMQM